MFLGISRQKNASQLLQHKQETEIKFNATKKLQQKTPFNYSDISIHYLKFTTSLRKIIYFDNWDLSRNVIKHLKKGDLIRKDNGVTSVFTGLTDCVNLTQLRCLFQTHKEITRWMILSDK